MPLPQDIVLLFVVAMCALCAVGEDTGSCIELNEKALSTACNEVMDHAYDVEKNETLGDAIYEYQTRFSAFGGANILDAYGTPLYEIE